MSRYTISAFRDIERRRHCATRRRGHAGSFPRGRPLTAFRLAPSVCFSFLSCLAFTLFLSSYSCHRFDLRAPVAGWQPVTLTHIATLPMQRITERITCPSLFVWTFSASEFVLSVCGSDQDPIMAERRPLAFLLMGLQVYPASSWRGMDSWTNELRSSSDELRDSCDA
jgi:hypothetical protein